MPVITIAMHTTSPAEKKALISALTESAVAVTKVPAEAFTVLIDEYPEDAIGIGGRTLQEVMAARR